jgi:hypothetical protein
LVIKSAKLDGSIGVKNDDNKINQKDGKF